MLRPQDQMGVMKSDLHTGLPVSWAVCATSINDMIDGTLLLSHSIPESQHHLTSYKEEKKKSSDSLATLKTSTVLFVHLFQSWRREGQRMCKYILLSEMSQKTNSCLKGFL